MKSKLYEVTVRTRVPWNPRKTLFMFVVLECRNESEAITLAKASLHENFVNVGNVLTIECASVEDNDEKADIGTWRWYFKREYYPDSHRTTHQDKDK